MAPRESENFSRVLKRPQEKPKTRLMQNLGRQTESIMVCYGISGVGGQFIGQKKLVFLIEGQNSLLYETTKLKKNTSLI